jgi:hypothetical protein
VISIAQIDRAELIERVINLVQFESLVVRSTIHNHLIQPLKNPAIDCRSRCLRPTGSVWLRPAVSDRGYRRIVKIA